MNKHRDYWVLELCLAQKTTNPDKIESKLFELSALNVEIDIKSKFFNIRAYFFKDPSEQINPWLNQIKVISSQIFEFRLPSYSGESRLNPFYILPNFEVVYQLSEKKRANQIFINPQQSFGTGLHPSTQIAAKLLAELNPKPQNILDIGCGSGILSIIAYLLGIKQITAVEILPEARASAHAHFKHNNIKEFKLVNRLEELTESYDLIIANLQTKALSNLRKKIDTHLKPEAHLILSGIQSSEKLTIVEKFNFLKLKSILPIEDWTGFHYIKNS